MIATAAILKGLSPQDFLSLGVQQLAYIRAVTVDGNPVFAIYGADGRQLGVHDDILEAQALTRQNELEPLTVQ